jgi:hypothetical protein
MLLVNGAAESFEAVGEVAREPDIHVRRRSRAD